MSSTAPAVVQPAKAPVPLGAPQHDLDTTYRFAHALAQSSLLPPDLRGKPSDVLVTILYGQELGLSPMQAIQAISVVKGRPQMSGKLWLTKVRQAGHRVEFPEKTDTACTVTITRGDTGETETERFTLDDAVHAKLLQIKDGKPWARSSKGEPLPWESYTRRMLMWRAVSNCATVICPEVAMGFGAEEPMPTQAAPSGPVLATVVGPAAEKPATPAPDEPAPDLADEYAELEREHLADAEPADGGLWPEDVDRSDEQAEIEAELAEQ